MSYGYEWAPYVPVAERRRKAAQEMAALQKKGVKISPVVIEGRAIAKTFWGKAWCDNLESYSDYENRLPRGRTYVRNGSVVDLQIDKGRVSAKVQGSSMYRVEITIGAVEAQHWQKITGDCAGQIASVIELLQGKLSRGVMDVITAKGTGLFPAPKHIRLHCSCPDSATMCKHVAAALYGVGARLDREPELLFRLRSADPTELVAKAARAGTLGAKAPAKEKVLGGNLASMFGIDFDEGPAAAPAKVAPAKAAPAKAAPAKSKAARPAKAAPKPATITSMALSRLGVPAATIQYWIKTQVLLRTAEQGVYLETPVARERMKRYEHV